MSLIKKIKQFINGSWQELVLDSKQATNLNLENGEGNGSIQQSTYTIESKNPKATGLGAVAFGGFRGDKPEDEPDPSNRTTEARGIQSAVFGCGNLAAGDWSFVSGKDNTVYSNRAFVSGGANMSYKIESVTGMSYEKTNVGRFNAIFGNNNTFQSSNELNESNLIAGGSNTIDTERSIIVGYGNNVKGAFDAVFGINNKVDSTRSIIGGEGNTIYGDRHLVSGANNTVDGQYNLVSGQNNKNRGYHSATIGNTAYVGYNKDGSETSVMPTGAIALGWSRANGHYTLSSGYDVEAIHDYSVALNCKTVTGRNSQTVVGEFNAGKDSTFFEVGNGTTSERKNAFEVLKTGGFNSYGDSVVEGQIKSTSIKTNTIFADLLSDGATIEKKDPIIKVEFADGYANGQPLVNTHLYPGVLRLHGSILPHGNISIGNSSWKISSIHTKFLGVGEGSSDGFFTVSEDNGVRSSRQPTHNYELVRLIDLNNKFNEIKLTYATEEDILNLWA